MISYPLLGSYGRLGNQMFQVAATLSIADVLKTKAVFPTGAQILDVFSLEDCEFSNSIEAKFIYEERSFLFDKNVFELPDYCAIKGYFQSEKYFLGKDSLIRKNFTFKNDILSVAQDAIKAYGNNVCAIHVRRGDYLKFYDTHPYVGDDYYTKSINLVREKSPNCKFIVFSDDIDWCKNNRIFQDCHFVENKTDVVELCMMTLCNYHIIANSSFSWWGSKLSSSEMTIAPKTWFGPKGPEDWVDVYCNGWAVV